MSEAETTRDRAASRESLFVPLLIVLALAGIALIWTLGKKSAAEVTLPLRAVETKLKAKHKLVQAKELAAACRTRDCGCMKRLASAALDIDANAEALTVLNGAVARCPAAGLSGMRAEALIRSGDRQRGMAEVQKALAGFTNDPYAITALGLSAYREKRYADAMVLADQATRERRGLSANYLLGLAAFDLGDFGGARSEFEKILKGEPSDVEALYALALVAQKQNRYGEARNRLLRVAKLDKKHTAARYHLALLSHSVGAKDEAKHHLEKLRKIPGSAALAAKLSAELERPLAKPPAQALKLGAPAATVSAAAAAQR